MVVCSQVDCNQHLEWYKTAAESFSSVETSSMSEVEKVNRKGVYVVGSISQRDETGCSGEEVVSLDNALRLFVGEFPAEVKDVDLLASGIKCYSLDDIRDLQSKLMLIGGKRGRTKEPGQIETAYFIRVCTCSAKFFFQNVFGSNDVTTFVVCLSYFL